MSSWIDHIKKYAKDNNLPYSQAMKEAKDSYVKGGSLGSKDLKKVLASTYEKNNKDVGNFKVDNQLSGKRAKIYHNDETGQTIVAHRGTASAKDWYTDAKMALGFEGGNRFKYAKKVQKQAEQKYGTDNLTTVGHSLGARLAEKFGNNGKEIITLNKPIIPKTVGKKVSDKQYDIRSSTDVVSALAKTQKNKNLTTVKTKTANPLLEHKTNILNRKDKEFGKIDKPEQINHDDMPLPPTSKGSSDEPFPPMVSGAGSGQIVNGHHNNHNNHNNHINDDYHTYFNNLNALQKTALRQYIETLQNEYNIRTNHGNNENENDENNGYYMDINQLMYTIMNLENFINGHNQTRNNVDNWLSAVGMTLTPRTARSEGAGFKARKLGGVRGKGISKLEQELNRRRM